MMRNRFAKRGFTATSGTFFGALIHCAAFDSASIHLAQDSEAFCAKLRGVKPLLATIFLAAIAHSADTDTKTLRVFIFAGQSNMAVFIRG